MSQRKLLYVVPLMLSTLFLAGCSRKPVYLTSNGGIGPACWHKEMPWSEYECFDMGFERFDVANVDSVTITFRLRDGRTITRTLPPRTDAIFLSRPALENLLLRHYDATDPEKARELRARIARDWR